MSCRAPAGSGATEGSVLPKLLLLGTNRQDFVSGSAQGQKELPFLSLPKERRFPKVLGVFAAAAQVSHPVALQSGVSQVFSLKEPHPVETAGECHHLCWNASLKPGTSQYLPVADVTAQPGREASCAQRVQFWKGMCWEPSCASWSIPSSGTQLWKGQHR